MRNSSHPLLQALSRRSKASEPPVSMPEVQRLFEIKKEDIPAAARFDPGDNAKFVVHGRVKSMHDDGTMMLHVHKVEHQKDETPQEDAPESIQVETQESHAP